MLPITISGPVKEGQKLGRRIGFPTANIAVAGDKNVANGVYVCRVSIGGESYGAVANLGVKPTVKTNGARALEVHIFDFDGNLYGQTIEVELIELLRAEKKFDSIEELSSQIERDKKNAVKYLEECI